jgi:hypothetical protein
MARNAASAKDAGRIAAADAERSCRRMIDLLHARLSRKVLGPEGRRPS